MYCLLLLLVISGLDNDLMNGNVGFADYKAVAYNSAASYKPMELVTAPAVPLKTRPQDCPEGCQNCPCKCGECCCNKTKTAAASPVKDLNANSFKEAMREIVREVLAEQTKSRPAPIQTTYQTIEAFESPQTFYGSSYNAAPQRSGGIFRVFKRGGGGCSSCQ